MGLPKFTGSIEDYEALLRRDFESRARSMGQPQNVGCFGGRERDANARVNQDLKGKGCKVHGFTHLRKRARGNRTELRCRVCATEYEREWRMKRDGRERFAKPPAHAIAPDHDGPCEWRQNEWNRYCIVQKRIKDRERRQRAKSSGK